ncbi:hypothetical protein FEM48_Zijuj08G0064600 [Ziziphus jujuba var. spinosa]|uniref:Uncharacterized protein n=1 Tax=Ziziphus jujuba var. spinosa TaxID=714518 RepID=A0A978UXH9_ZIZJJ|nr:hypothetical protein FEM48_Zijuj08G0064600 [Ziziphus jujuba var. spinosa]
MYGEIGLEDSDLSLLDSIYQQLLHDSEVPLPDQHVPVPTFNGLLLPANCSFPDAAADTVSVFDFGWFPTTDQVVLSEGMVADGNTIQTEPFHEKAGSGAQFKAARGSHASRIVRVTHKRRSLDHPALSSTSTSFDSGSGIPKQLRLG